MTGLRCDVTFNDYSMADFVQCPSENFFNWLIFGEDGDKSMVSPVCRLIHAEVQ